MEIVLIEIKETLVHKNNKWNKGPMHLEFPPLTSQLKGKNGCRIEKAVFDPSIGEEVFIKILDEPIYAKELASTKPFNLFCKTGMVRTNQGIVLFILFIVTNGIEEIITFETLLNPHEMSTVNLLSSWGQQSHLKVVVMDNQKGDILNWYEFKNIFGIGDVVKTIAECIGHEEKGDFILAQQEFHRKYELEDLKKM